MNQQNDNISFRFHNFCGILLNCNNFLFCAEFGVNSLTGTFSFSSGTFGCACRRRESEKKKETQVNIISLPCSMIDSFHSVRTFFKKSWFFFLCVYLFHVMYRSYFILLFCVLVICLYVHMILIILKREFSKLS